VLVGSQASAQQRVKNLVWAALAGSLLA